MSTSTSFATGQTPVVSRTQSIDTTTTWFASSHLKMHNSDVTTDSLTRGDTGVILSGITTTVGDVTANTSDVARNFSELSVNFSEVSTTLNDIMADYMDEEEDDGGWTLYKQVLVGIVLFTLCFVIVAGNVLTVLVFLRDAKIRTVQNMYIFNLAMTDLFIGFSSVPFYAIYTVLDYDWLLGYEFCKVWSLIDYWVCAESSLTIILISHDRLLMVTKGATYIHAETKTKALIKILVTWFASFLIYGPAVIGYNYWRGYSTIEERDCDVEFATEFWYTVFTAFLEFCVPFILLVSFSAMLYTNLTKRTKRIKKPLKQNTVAVVTIDGNSQVKPGAAKKNDSVNLSKDKKAARSLAILIVTYAICWTPYTIMTVVITFCDNCISDDIYAIATWLLWANSAFNPFLYAATNQRFRNNFESLLCKLVNKDRVHPVKSSSQGTTQQISTSKA